MAIYGTPTLSGENREEQGMQEEELIAEATEALKERKEPFDSHDIEERERLAAEVFAAFPDADCEDVADSVMAAIQAFTSHPKKPEEAREDAEELALYLKQRYLQSVQERIGKIRAKAKESLRRAEQDREGEE